MKTTQNFPYSMGQIVVKSGLILLAIYLTNLGVINKFFYFISLEKYFSFLVFLIIWASALIAIFCTAFNPDRRRRSFWGSLFVISTFGGQLYYAITGEQLSYDAIEVLWNARHRPEDALFFVGENLIYPALASIFLFISVVIIPPFIKIRRSRSWILFISPLIPLTMIALTVYKLGGFVVAGLPAQFNTLSTTILFSLTPAQILKKNEVKISLNHKAMAKHIVLIIDESVHGEFISLKGNLNTTPFLKTQQPSIVNFGLAISGNNCSSASNAILRLGANPATLGHKEHHLLSNPSIWKYAKKAGFETTHLDAQMTKGRLVNFMNSVEYELIDHFIQIENVDYYEKDYEAARILENLLKKPEPQFIYVNKRGCHFPYEHMYPAHMKIFTPCMTSDESISNREHLLNSYKNAVRWNVDGFFKTLLPHIDLTNVIIIYTSDHGQNLLHDGQPITHCRRTYPDINEAIVPLLIFTHNLTAFKKFKKAAQLNFNKASHFQIYPTLLTLFGYDLQQVEDKYGKSLFDTIEKPLGFTSGPIFSPFGHTQSPIWNKDSGIISTK